jgi:tRNA (Thr-GGU) A37 N-methylase
MSQVDDNPRLVVVGVRLLAVEDGLRLRVAPLEALDGTPIVDLEPVLGGGEG